MPSDFLHTILPNLWAVFLVILLFGGSIFVHELGHFLAARRRGVKVERFSIGFGPAIWSWRGRDGVDYRISWIPLGGYVLLPQLADLGAIEGEVQSDASKLPPVSYLTKMIVFVAGATFNILFAFALACIVSIIGQPTDGGLESTTVGEVLPTIKTADGREVVSPAIQAGLKAGDVVLAIDGEKVMTFGQIREHLALSSGWTKEGERETVFTVQRGDQSIDLSIRPVIGGREKFRMVGFAPEERLLVGALAANSAATRGGLALDDQIVAVNGATVSSRGQLLTALRASPEKFDLAILRAGQRQTLTLERLPGPKDGADIGLQAFKSGILYTHPNPFRQIADSVSMTIRNLKALVNPRSDINASHMSGPIGIISNFFEFSRAGLPFALWFTIVVNVNLAIFNLLPLPVLDGGQMFFASIARLRGRPLPVNFIMTAQSVFLVLILSMILYVSFFDVRRWRDMRPDRAEPASTAPTPTPAAARPPK